MDEKRCQWNKKLQKMCTITKELNVSMLIEELANKNVLNFCQIQTLEARMKAGRDREAANMLYQMIEHKPCKRQMRFFELVHEKQPCLVTEQDITELADSVWN